MYGPGGNNSEGLPDYIARSGLFEVLTINKELRKMIGEGCTAEEIERKAISGGMIEFRRAALQGRARDSQHREMMRMVPHCCARELRVVATISSNT